MKVSQITDENRLCFKELYVSKRTLKKTGNTVQSLLENPAIKDAAEKYQVHIKPGKNTYTVYKPSLPNSLSSIICLGSVYGAMLGAVVLTISAPIGFAIITASTLAYLSLYMDHKDYKTMLVQCGEKFERGKLGGVMTDIHEVENANSFVPNLVRELETKLQKNGKNA